MIDAVTPFALFVGIEDVAFPTFVAARNGVLALPKSHGS